MKLQVGYVPLTDAAPVIAAAHLGFAQDGGIEIELSPEPSWATGWRSTISMPRISWRRWLWRARWACPAQASVSSCRWR